PSTSRSACGTMLADPISVGGFQYNSQFAQAAQQSDLLILPPLEIRLGERAPPGPVALPDPHPSERAHHVPAHEGRLRR
ncbi:hypothetical protein AEQ27_14800, partial [Frigoribacterium sp. RIT-PI-h]